MSTYRLNALVTLALMLSLITFEFSQAQSEDGTIYEVENKRQGSGKYCGSKLSSILQLVCNGLFNKMFKKSGVQEMKMNDYPFYDDNLDNPLRTRARAMLRYGGDRYRRYSRGVHDECCVKACSIDEMRSYCAKS